MAAYKSDLTQPLKVGPLLRQLGAGLAVPKGYKQCAKPGTHRARRLGEHVVCPGCDWLCRVPEGVGHDDEIRTVKLITLDELHQ